MTNHQTLTHDQQIKLSTFSHILQQFLTPHKYLFLTPISNLSFPPLLKPYIHPISIPPKTFKYSPQPPQPFLTHKK
ncbi:NAD(P)H-dependent oxidoreductase, partial [Staphylococcus aureus]|uniref:NAD(P)H-dependent oxidoreductase n=1 Tax=Staphylococcus aureus TaxID=1280 RepID=UPI0037D9D75F